MTLVEHKFINLIKAILTVNVVLYFSFRIVILPHDANKFVESNEAICKKVDKNVQHPSGIQISDFVIGKIMQSALLN